MKLYRKIMLLIIVVVFISIISFMPFALTSLTKNIQQEIQVNIMNIANTVADSYYIRENLERNDPERLIASYIDNIYKDIIDIEFIVVADMDSIRFSHPNDDQIGKQFVGNDEIAVINEADTYVSEGVGTLGKSLRAFVPVYALDNKTQIGFVSVGTLTNSVTKAKFEAQIQMFFVAFIGLLVGSIGAFLLSQSIKKSLLGLEPEEISKLYNEKDSMLKAIHEGIIAIDSNSNINMINDSAMKILQLEKKYSSDDLMGLPIKKVFKNSRLPLAIETGLAEYNHEQLINNTIIVTNIVPIIDKENIIGALATFKDKTQITNLAEEVTGVKLIVEALRANTHEFMNKLHVILGLINLGELERAKTFILQTSESQEMIVTNIIHKIKDPTIAGLLIGKTSRAKEINIDFGIDEESFLEDSKSRKIANSTLITIIGNLLENSFEAVNQSNSLEKKVQFKIQESSQQIWIVVHDTGIGIAAKDIDLIFTRGYSTKKGSKGVGLDLVKKNVDILGGDISIMSELGSGTTFSVIIPKKIKGVSL